MCMEQEMLCLSLLGSAILVVLVTTAAAAPQYSLWTLGETQKPPTARCWGPGTWPHPSHCRLFTVCHPDWDGSIVGHLFLCPLGSSYYSRTQNCIVNQAVTSECAKSLEDNSLLDSLSVEQLSSDMPLQHRCGEAMAPYCADNEILVICTPNKVLVGAVNCSVQHWAKNTEPLQCDKCSNRCAASSAWQLHQDSAVQTSTQNSSVAFSHNLAPNHMDLNLHLHDNKTTTTNMHLQKALPAMSTESIYDSEFYVGDKENDVYDVEDSVPDYLDIKCTQKGIQCVDNTTIMGCSENMNEQFFAMSCNSLLYGDEGENVASYCDNETSSCIVTSEGMTVTVNIKTANSEDLKICESHSGLRCVNNETMIACSGDASSIHYTVSCNGVATSETDSFLQGQCHENSCIFVTVNQSNISDIQESNIVNYDTYHLVSPDTNSTTNESSDRNVSMTYDLLQPNNHSSANKLLYTKINATYLWPPTYANSVISESLQTNIGVSQLLLPTDDDGAASESLHSNKSETYYLMPLESNSTINESLYSIINVTYNILPPDADSAASDSPYSTTGVTYHLLPSDNDSFKIQSLYTHISSVTNTTDIHEEPDTPVMQVEMSDLYDKHEVIKYNLSMAGEEYFVDDSKTEANIANSSSSGNHDLVTYSAEKILQTAQHDSSQINDYLMIDEKSPPDTAVSNADFELPPPPTGNSLEVMKSEVPSETSSLLNLDIPVTSETETSMKNPASPTEISLSSSGSIVTETNTEVSKTTTRETISFAPEIIPKGSTILIFKSTPTETAFTVPETVPTKILTPVSKVIPTESFSALETKPTEIAIPVSKSSHTENDFPVPATLLTEITTPTTKSIETATAFSTHETVPIKTVTPISKLIHTENYFFVPEAVYTEITTHVSKLMPTETLFTVPETVHQEMTPVSNTIDTKITFSATETVPTENVTLVSKLLHRETTFSVPETVSTDTLTHISKLIPADTASPVTENATTEMTPVSKTIHTAMTFSAPGTFSTELTTPVSKLISTEMVFPVPETSPKKMISESKTMNIETVFPEITTTLSKIIPTKTVFLVPETVYTEITPLSKTIHTETVLSVPETLSVEMTSSISKLVTTEKVSPDPDIVPTQMTPFSKTVHNEFGLFANESVPTESGVLILKPIHKETALSVPKPVSTEVTTLVSNVTLIQNASPVSQIIPKQVIMPTSKLNLTETDFSVHQNIFTQAITPLSQLIPTKTAFPFSDNILAEDTTPASKLIPTQSAPLLHETIPTQARAPVSKGIPIETAYLVTKTIPTETKTSISKFIHREDASSILALMPGEIMNFNSGTTVNFSQPTMLVTEDKTMVSKLIPVTGTQEAGVSSITDLHSHLQAISSVSAIHSASETITSMPSAHVSEFMSTRSTRITPTAEMDQPERLVTASNAAMSKPSDISDIQQKNVCYKVGIQCIDRLTLGACLPDLTLSYTVSCQMLLPYVMSKHHDVYCNKESDTCAIAPVV